MQISDSWWKPSENFIHKINGLIACLIFSLQYVAQFDGHQGLEKMKEGYKGVLKTEL